MHTCHISRNKTDIVLRNIWTWYLTLKYNLYFIVFTMFIVMTVLTVFFYVLLVTIFFIIFIYFWPRNRKMPVDFPYFCRTTVPHLIQNHNELTQNYFYHLIVFIYNNNVYNFVKSTFGCLFVKSSVYISIFTALLAEKNNLFNRDHIEFGAHVVRPK